VVERLGPFGSLGRSARLTKGHRWAVFAVFLLVFIAAAVIGFVVGFVLGSVQAATGGPVITVGTLIWNALWLGYYNSVVVMTYHDLRAAKEGLGTDDIAAVFD